MNNIGLSAVYTAYNILYYI